MDGRLKGSRVWAKTVAHCTSSTCVSFQGPPLLQAMFCRLLRAPVTTYFGVVTSGEICNKFSKDLEIADVQLPDFLIALLSHLAQLVLLGSC